MISFGEIVLAHEYSLIFLMEILAASIHRHIYKYGPALLNCSGTFSTMRAALLRLQHCILSAHGTLTSFANNEPLLPLYR